MNGFGRRAACLCAVGQLACSGLYVPASQPFDPESAARATETLEAASDQIQVEEDGLTVHEGFYYEDRLEPVLVPDPGDPMGFELMPQQRHVKQLVGPRRFYLAYEDVRGVSVRSWPMYTAVQLDVAPRVLEDVEDAHGPVVIEAEDEDQARALADAIHHLLRAVEVRRTGVDPEPAASSFGNESGDRALEPALPPS